MSAAQSLGRYVRTKLSRKATIALDLLLGAAIAVIPEKTIRRPLGALDMISCEYGDGTRRFWLASGGEIGWRHEIDAAEVERIARHLRAAIDSPATFEPVRLQFDADVFLLFEMLDTTDGSKLFRSRYASPRDRLTGYPTRLEIDSILQDIALAAHIRS